MPDGAHTYVVHGLRMSTEIGCPELVKAPDPGELDIRVRLALVPRELRAPTVRGVAFQATADKFLLEVVSVARYLAEAGSELAVQPHPGADETSMRLFLLHEVMGAVLHQRGLLPICGSAIETPRGAVVFSGPAALGKSTLAALFCRRGYRLLSDGICCIATGGQQPQLQPSTPRLSLWSDSLERLKIPTCGLEPVRPSLEQRYWYPVHGDLRLVLAPESD